MATGIGHEVKEDLFQPHGVAPDHQRLHWCVKAYYPSPRKALGRGDDCTQQDHKIHVGIRQRQFAGLQSRNIHQILHQDLHDLRLMEGHRTATADIWERIGREIAVEQQLKIPLDGRQRRAQLMARQGQKLIQGLALQIVGCHVTDRYHAPRADAVLQRLPPRAKIVTHPIRRARAELHGEGRIPSGSLDWVVFRGETFPTYRLVLDFGGSTAKSPVVRGVREDDQAAALDNQDGLVDADQNRRQQGARHFGGVALRIEGCCQLTQAGRARVQVLIRGLQFLDRDLKLLVERLQLFIAGP